MLIISFAWTTAALLAGAKTCTRRSWNDDYASWWDEDARQMFEDGFFKSGKGLQDSVLQYAEDMGILAK